MEVPGGTALFAACLRGHGACARALLEAGASPAAARVAGTPEQAREDGGHPSAAEGATTARVRWPPVVSAPRARGRQKHGGARH